MNAPLHDNGQPTTLRYLWNHPIVIAGVMGMLLLLVTAVSIIAIKAVGDDSRAAGDPDGQQTTDQAVAPASTPPAGGTPPANQTATNRPAGSQPPAAGTLPQTTGAVFLNGTMSIYSYDAGIDFDSANKSTTTGNQEYDVEIGDTALSATNQAKLGTGAAASSPEACAAAAVKWADSAHLSVLGNGAVICVRTSGNRLGAFTVAKLQKSSDGQLSQLDINYVVWKKPDDQ